jgi:hypothetical protein
VIYAGLAYLTFQVIYVKPKRLMLKQYPELNERWVQTLTVRYRRAEPPTGDHLRDRL